MYQAARQLVFDVRPIQQQQRQGQRPRRHTRTLTQTKPNSVHIPRWRPRIGVTTTSKKLPPRCEEAAASPLAAFKIRRLRAKLQSVLKPASVSTSTDGRDVVVVVKTMSFNILQARLFVSRLNENNGFRKHFEACDGLKQIDGGFEFLTKVR